MWSAPVEKQCGPTCAIYAFKNVLEGLIRRKLSAEYALLAMAAMDLQTRDKVLSTREYNSERYKELSVHNPNAIFGVDGLISFANYGIYLANDFPFARAARIFKERFGRDLSSENILLIHAEAIKHMNASIEAARLGDLARAEEEIVRYRALSKDFQRYMSGISRSAKSEWQRRYSDYRFEVVQVRKDAFSERQAGWYKYLFQAWLPDPALASVINYSSERFNARVLHTLIGGRPIYIATRNDGKDDGHAVVGFAYLRDPEPLMAVRNSGVQDAEDFSQGAIQSIDFYKVGTYYDFAIIPIAK
jgi:hypothetical protein